eukprot:TRINITY_DN12939_c0_g1_i1.p1 TRINITY_DN12939_c0_g1~~TRINITY_DN12939_c0_g1_i1.p1  ORF type:complete len:411 (-),score=61.28 TRINITY_DN12939_c0_g1_i1:416-1621(-)
MGSGGSASRKSLGDDQIAVIRDDISRLGKLGIDCIQRKQYSMASQHFTDALSMSREISDRQNELAMLHSLGKIQYDLEQDDTALEYHSQALAISQEIRDREKERVCLHNLGLTCTSLKRHDEAVRYFNAAVDVSDQIGDWHAKGDALSVLGNIYWEVGRHDEALQSYTEALRLTERVGDRTNQMLCLFNIACLQSLQEYSTTELAIRNYSQAAVMSQEVGDHELRILCLDGIGKIYERLKQYDKAIHYHNEALALSKEMDNPTNEYDCSNNLVAALAMKPSMIKQGDSYPRQVDDILSNMRQKRMTSKGLLVIESPVLLRSKSCLDNKARSFTDNKHLTSADLPPSGCIQGPAKVQPSTCADVPASLPRVSVCGTFRLTEAFVEPSCPSSPLHDGLRRWDF